MYADIKSYMFSSLAERLSATITKVLSPNNIMTKILYYMAMVYEDCNTL